MPDPMTIEQFGQTIKAKHPEYSDMPDAVVGQKVLDKYPQYADMVKSPSSGDSQVWQGVKEFGNEINPVAGLKGAAQAVAHPIDTLVQDKNARSQIYAKAEEAFKNGDYAGGAAHLLYSFLPMVGPAMDTRGEQAARGEYGKAIGGSLGMGVNLAAPAIIKGAANAVRPAINAAGDAAQGMAKRMYQSALKPSPGSYSTSQVNSMVGAGLENGIPVSAAGAEKLSALVSDLNDKVKAQIASGNQAGATVNKFKVASRLSDTTNKFATQVNPESDLAAISDSGNEFLRNQPAEIPVADAQSLKQGTYKQLKDKAYGGELRSATVESQKALARGIKEELEAQFPEIKGMNAQEAKLINLDGALERALRRIDNHQLLGIGTPIAAGAAGAITGNPITGAAVGIMKAVIDDPMLKSKLAIALNRAGRNVPGGISNAAAIARVQGYVNLLGSSASGELPSGQTNQQ